MRFLIIFIFLITNVVAEELPNIKNFEPYFDPPTTLAKMFSLRGVPTTILINKEGQEFARIIGSIDFEDKNFVNWIKKYN